VELVMPLYDEKLNPCWFEHPERHKIDIAVLEIPRPLEENFQFVDIQSVEDEGNIPEVVAKDVFILGYPFKKDDFKNQFGDDVPYYLPVWKRGSIASEPELPLGGRVILIDSLSRAGMSGAPVLIAEDRSGMRARTAEADAVIRRIAAGDTSALRELDMSKVEDVRGKQFRLLGVYSGTIGSTKLAEVALGKCWTVKTLADVLSRAVPGVMPFHGPEPNPYYDEYLNRIAGGDLIMLDAKGDEISRVPLGGTQ